MLICTRVVAALLRSIHSVILCFRFEDFIYSSLAVFSSAASLLVDSPHVMPSHSCCFNRVLFSAVTSQDSVLMLEVFVSRLQTCL